MASQSDYYGNVDLRYAEVGIAMQKIDRMNPGMVKFSIPTLTPGMSDHEDRNDHLLPDRIAGKSRIQHSESSGASRSEGQAERVKDRHSEDQEQHHLHHGQRDVHLVQDPGGLACLRDHLLHAGARALRLHQEHRAAAGCQRYNRHDKHQDSHAAYPVGK